MKRVALIFTAAVLVSCVSAQKVKDYTTSGEPTANRLTLTVDSIDFRKDLTRVYGKITGHSNTSDRFDRISLSRPDGVIVELTDIDGVDMERWFQWEEDGNINLEIDFPAMKAADKLIINTYSPKGDGNWTVSREAMHH